MTTFRQFVEAMDRGSVPLIGSDISGPVRTPAKPPPLPAQRPAAPAARPPGGANPVLASAVAKVKAIYQQSKTSQLGSLKLNVGSNNIYGGKLTLIQKWGLTNDEVNALTQAGLYTPDNGVGDAVLVIPNH